MTRQFPFWPVVAAIVGLIVCMSAVVALLTMDKVSYIFRFPTAHFTARDIEAVEKSVATVLEGYRQRDGKSAGSQLIVNRADCLDRHQCSIYIHFMGRPERSDIGYQLTMYSSNSGTQNLRQLFEVLDAGFQTALQQTPGTVDYEVATKTRLTRTLNFIKSEF